MRPLFARLRLESDDCNRPSEFNPPLGYTRSHLRDPYRGLIYARKGEYDRAIQDYDQAIRLNPNDAQAFNNRGNVYVTKGQYDRAIQDYDQAIRLNPKDAKALLYRGIAQFEQGEFDAPA